MAKATSTKKKSEETPKYKVSGQVFNSNGEPIAGQEVMAVDVDLRGAAIYNTAATVQEIKANKGFELLGNTKTDTDGYYEVLFAKKDLKKNEIGLADVIVFAVDAQKIAARSILATTQNYTNGKEIQRLNITLTDSLKRGVSEYTRLIKVLEPFVKENGLRLSDLNNSDDQIAFLARETSQDGSHTTFAVEADALANIQSQYKFSPELFYGIGRQNIQLSWSSLISKTTDNLVSALQLSIDQNIIDALDSQALKAFAEQVGHQAIESVSTDVQSDLNKTITFSLKDPTLQKTFLQSYSSFSGRPADFWERLSKQNGFTTETVQSLQLSNQLSLLTGQQTALIESLQVTKNIKALPDLLGLSAEDWQKIISPANIPDSIPGTTTQEKTTAYINGMQNLLNAAFPTQKISLMIQSNQLAIGDANVKEKLSAFLSSGSGFDFATSRISDFEAPLKNLSGNLFPQVLQSLQKIQRIFQVSPSPEAMNTLISRGYTSAYHISTTSQSAFLQKESQALGGTDIAFSVYNRAVHQVTQARYTFLKAQDMTNKGIPGKIISATQIEAVVNAVSTTLNWNNLFGPAQDCECDDCKSIFSPASYLVDIMQYLDSCNKTMGLSPLRVLLIRRPDIKTLLLTCENTNTEIPYIDLVNEVMEYYVARSEDASLLFLFGNTGDATAAELRAEPQNVLIDAYFIIYSKAVYPFNLPYHQPLDVIRTWLGFLKTSRAELMEIFPFYTDASKSLVPIPATTLDAERVLLSMNEYQILTGSTTAESFFGIPSPPYTGNAVPVSDLLQRTGLIYTDLIAVLTTRFINPGQHVNDTLQTLISTSTILPQDLYNEIKNNTWNIASSQTMTLVLTPAKINPADFGNWINAVTDGATNFQHFQQLVTLYQSSDDCNINKIWLHSIQWMYEGQPATDVGITDAFLTNLHRFIRLWRKTGWSVHELDSMLTALNKSAVDPGLIHDLGIIIKITFLVPLSLLELSACWGIIDTFGDQSLYAQLFLKHTGNYNSKIPLPANPFIPNPLNEIISNSLLIKDYSAQVCGALSIAPTELSDILTDAGLNLTTALLSLQNLSILYRYKILSDALSVSISDLCTLKTICFAINPFDGVDTALDFIEKVQQLTKAGFSASVLNYILTGSIFPTDPLVLSQDQILAQLPGLWNALSQISLNNPVSDLAIINAALLSKKLMLLYSKDIADRFISMLGGSEPPIFSAIVPDPGYTIPASLMSKYSYVLVSSQWFLQSKGIMTDDEYATFLLTATGNIKSVIDFIYQSPAVFLRNTFAGLYKTENDLDTALLYLFGLSKINPSFTIPSGYTPLTTLTQKLTYFYTAFLPYLKNQLQQTEVVTVFSALTGLDPATTQILLAPVMAALIGSASETGLSAVYYKNIDFTDAIPLINDPQINFSWGLSSPVTTIPADNFSVRWTGWLCSPTDAEYTFTLNVTETDETAALWMDDQLLISINPPGTVSPVVTGQGWLFLKAGKMVRVVLEYTEHTNNAGIQWFWQSDSMAQSIIGSQFLFPDADVNNIISNLLDFHRAAQFINGFQLTSSEVAYFNSNPDFDNLNFAAISITNWLRMDAYTQLRIVIPAPSLLSIFGSAVSAFTSSPTAAPSDAFIKTLASAAGWNKFYLSYLAGDAGDATAIPIVPPNTGYLGFKIADFKNEKGLLQIKQALDLAKKTNMPVSDAGLPGWVQIETTPVTPDNFNALHAVAEQIKNAVKSKYKDNWLTIAGQLNDKIRENQKQALIAYMLTLGLQLNGEVLADANALFEYLLIDVQMTSIVVSSRLIQATMAVQLFADRCLLGLESEVAMSAINPDEWDWMKHYAIAAGLKKLFVYVENYLDPSLRDDKTPFFNDFESAINKGDITDQNAENAFRDYLYKLNEVANLEVSGMYNDDATGILHVFARTHAAPYTYYYRIRDQYFHWFPWEPVQLDIKSVDDGDYGGTHLMPFVWKNRIFLFWPEFSPKTAKPGTSYNDFQKLSNKATGSTESQSYWEIRLGWSEYANGKWSPKKVSKESFAPFLSDLMDKYAQYVDDYTYKIPQIPPHCYSFQLTVDAVTQLLSLSIMVGFEWFYNILGAKQGTNITPLIYSAYLPDITSRIGSTDHGAFLFLISNDPFLPQQEFDDNNYVHYQPFFEHFRINSTPFILENAHYLRQPTNHQVLFSDNLLISDFERTVQYPFFFTNTQSDDIYYVTPDGITSIQYVINGLKYANYAPLALAKYNVPPAPTPAPAPAGPGVLHTDEISLPSVPGLNVNGIKLSDSGTPTGKGSAKYMNGVLYDTPPYLNERIRIPWWPQTSQGLAFYTFYHPFVPIFIKKLNQGGVASLLAADTSSWPADPAYPNIDTSPTTAASDGGSVFAGYNPDFSLVKQYDPTDTTRNYYLQNVDFSEFGTYSGYNWELFFHAPFLVATRLSKNGKYADARKWFHYIFNPLSTETPYPKSDSTSNFWMTLPFKSTLADDMIKYIQSLTPGYDIDPGATPVSDNNRQIDEWRQDPFNAFLIARNRPIAFMKNVVMAYLDNLIAWGDDLFQTYTRENINEATQLYVMAAHILGPQPQYIPTRGAVTPKSYDDLFNAGLDDFGDAMVSYENTFPNTGEIELVISTIPPSILGIGGTLYFCVPPNDKLLGYWSTVGDRLFKIRHGQNIEGIVKPLALFQPPIDPALLLLAHSQGLDIASILADLESPAPMYRFSALLQKAKEFCGELVSLGSAVLSANEKQDAEGLSRLRQTQEIALQQMVTDIKSRAVLEAQSNVDALISSRNTAILRLQHYAEDMLGNTASAIVDTPVLPEDLDENTNLPSETIIAPVTSSIDTGLVGTDESGVSVIQKEKDEMDASQTAFEWQLGSSVGEALAGILNLFPKIEGHITPLGVGASVGFGGNNLGAAASALARVGQIISSVYSHTASQAARMSGYIRREQDWVFQANMAIREIVQTDRQLTAAQIRLQMAQHELTNHEQQIQQAQDVEQYLENKFSNQELYQWMLDQLNSVHKQAYTLAYGMARKAEKAYRFELGIADSNFIQYGYFNDSYLGITAGELLQLALNQMDSVYMDNNSREFELTKQISLVSLNPAALMQLIETGSCQFSIPEEWFDMDYPGHYFRRIKSVGISIPCVAGPYTTISSTLRLQQNNIRINPALLTTGNPYAQDPNNQDLRFVENNTPFTAIATSTAQNDSGTFELNFHDERYLPFEGAGAISTWQLELNGKFAKDGDPSTIVDMSQFDYRSIADVIVQLKFSSREDAGEFRQNAINNLMTYKKGNHFFRLLRARQDFPNEFYSFITKVSSAGDQTFTMTLDQNRFPYFAKSGVVTITEIKFIADSVLLTKLSLPGPKGVDLLGDNAFGPLLHGIADFSSKPLLVSATQTQSIPMVYTASGVPNQLTFDNLKELYMIVHYSIN